MFLFDYKSKAQRIITHFVFWLLYLAFFSFLATLNSKQTYFQVMLNGLIFIPVDIFATYFTIYLLIPTFLVTRKYLKFTISTLILAFCTIFLNQLISYFIYIPIFLPQYNGMKDFFQINYWYLLISTYTVVILASGIKLTKYWVKEQQDKTNLENQQIISELNLLKSQLNPHFLFNTLNNIDALIHINPDKASQSIIRLSELLRYVTYEIQNDFVDVAKEEIYLKSFIELHELRFGENLISFNSKISNPELQMAPMLLIPLVENAIKHGDKKGNMPAVIVNLKADEHIEFSVINTIPALEINKDKMGGIGLANLRRRLQLIYPNKHLFEVNIIENKYVVSLWIK